jgi:hypothetical protein
MSIQPVKTGDPDTDKVLSKVVKQISKRQPAIQTVSGVVKSEQINNGEIVLSVVKASSESPGSPSVDEGRLYFKLDGTMYKITGVKVG